MCHFSIITTISRRSLLILEPGQDRKLSIIPVNPRESRIPRLLSESYETRAEHHTTYNKRVYNPISVYCLVPGLRDPSNSLTSVFLMEPVTRRSSGQAKGQAKINRKCVLHGAM